MSIQSDNSPGSRGKADYLAQFVRIPMRDGIELGGVLYRPREALRPLPTVLEITPYLADNLHGEAIVFAREGFAYLAVDCRGRGGSGGEFRQWIHDAPDGYDTVQWIATQPWSDGQVGLGGGSYTGWNQWMIAATRPPALKTIVPSAAFMPGVCIPRGGIGSPYQYRWRVTLKGHSISWNLAADTLLFNRMQGDLYAANRSYLDVPEMLGFPAPGWEDDITDTAWGPAWEARRPSEEALAALDIPVLSLTGTYDTTQVGALEHHRRLERLGSDSTRRNNHLVIGPWDHRGMDGTDQVYGLKFGPEAKVDVPRLRMDWYRWAFGLGEKPAFLERRIRYYVAGEEKWRSADSLEQAFGSARNWFLASNGSATDVFRSGWMQTEAADTPADAFVSDPGDLRPLETETRLSNSPEMSSGGGAVFPRAYNSLFFIMGGEDPTNAVFCHNTYGQGVIYHMPALDAPVTIVGEPELDLWLRCDAPDADLAVLLYEVMEDGSAIFLSSSQLRLRHRDAVESLMPEGQPVKLRLPRFRFVSRRIDRHSRLRLVIRAPACAFMQKNLNTATPVHLQQPQEARVARIEILHSREHPSVLRVPVCGEP